MNAFEYNNLTNFYSKLKDKKSNKILNDLFLFINTSFNEIIEKTKDVTQLSDILQDYICKKVNEFAKLWDYDFTHSKIFYLEFCEGFENLIFKSLYNKLFSLIPKETKFERLKRKYSFLNLLNLGIDLALDEFDIATQIKSTYILNRFERNILL